MLEQGVSARRRANQRQELEWHRLKRMADYCRKPLLRRPSDHPGDEDEDASPYEAGDQITDPTADRHTEHAEQQTSNCGAYDAEHDVHHKSHLALHEVLGKPTGDSANDDCRKPADLLVFHESFSEQRRAACGFASHSLS